MNISQDVIATRKVVSFGRHAPQSEVLLLPQCSVLTSVCRYRQSSLGDDYYYYYYYCIWKRDLHAYHSIQCERRHLQERSGTGPAYVRSPKICGGLLVPSVYFIHSYACYLFIPNGLPNVWESIYTTQIAKKSRKNPNWRKADMRTFGRIVQ